MFCGCQCQGTKCRRNIAENYNRLHEHYRRQTDDRQTAGRQHIAKVIRSLKMINTTQRILLNVLRSLADQRLHGIEFLIERTLIKSTDAETPGVWNDTTNATVKLCTSNCLSKVIEESSQTVTEKAARVTSSVCIIGTVSWGALQLSLTWRHTHQPRDVNPWPWPWP